MRTALVALQENDKIYALSSHFFLVSEQIGLA